MQKPQCTQVRRIFSDSRGVGIGELGEREIGLHRLSSSRHAAAVEHVRGSKPALTRAVSAASAAASGSNTATLARIGLGRAISVAWPPCGFSARADDGGAAVRAGLVAVEANQTRPPPQS